ncbi:unnamed protein product [Ixodes persulcatus]
MDCFYNGTLTMQEHLFSYRRHWCFECLFVSARRLPSGLAFLRLAFRARSAREETVRFWKNLHRDVRGAS